MEQKDNSYLAKSLENPEFAKVIASLTQAGVDMEMFEDLEESDTMIVGDIQQETKKLAEKVEELTHIPYDEIVLSHMEKLSDYVETSESLLMQIQCFLEREDAQKVLMELHEITETLKPMQKTCVDIGTGVLNSCKRRVCECAKKMVGMMDGSFASESAEGRDKEIELVREELQEILEGSFGLWIVPHLKETEEVVNNIKKMQMTLQDFFKHQKPSTSDSSRN